MKEKIVLNNIEYEIIENKKETFNMETVSNLYTSYFEIYDYILGDRAYGKIRMKGFCTKNNKNFNEINNYSNIEEYINKYCAHECGYFILKKTIQN